jgi:hypothetical protein
LPWLPALKPAGVWERIESVTENEALVFGFYFLLFLNDIIALFETLCVETSNILRDRLEMTDAHNFQKYFQGSTGSLILEFGTTITQP